MDCFSQIPAYLERMHRADNGGKSQLKTCQVTGAFKAVAITPSATINASRYIRGFYALDACHIKSQFPMMLMIAVSINANNNVVPLA